MTSGPYTFYYYIPEKRDCKWKSVDCLYGSYRQLTIWYSHNVAVVFFTNLCRVNNFTLSNTFWSVKNYVSMTKELLSSKKSMMVNSVLKTRMVTIFIIGEVEFGVFGGSKLKYNGSITCKKSRLKCRTWDDWVSKRLDK